MQRANRGTSTPIWTMAEGVGGSRMSTAAMVAAVVIRPAVRQDWLPWRVRRQNSSPRHRPRTNSGSRRSGTNRLGSWLHAVRRRTVSEPVSCAPRLEASAPARKGATPSTQALTATTSSLREDCRASQTAQEGEQRVEERLGRERPRHGVPDGAAALEPRLGEGERGGADAGHLRGRRGGLGLGEEAHEEGEIQRQREQVDGVDAREAGPVEVARRPDEAGPARPGSCRRG